MATPRLRVSRFLVHYLVGLLTVDLLFRKNLEVWINQCLKLTVIIDYQDSATYGEVI